MQKDGSLEKLLRREIRRHGVPGASVAVLKGGRIVAAATAGVTNLDTQVPVTTDTVFQVGSITKVFTTTLIMQLVDEGLVSLDTPIVEYLPEFRVADQATRRGVTARHLLTHTSGIDGDYFVDSGRGDDAIERFVQMSALLPSLFPLGAKMSYCNAGFAVLGRVIEVLTRESYDQAIRKRIFNPLGMTHAMTLPEDALKFRCAIGHVADPKRKNHLITAPIMHLSGLKAAGATPAMSATDLLTFVAAHLAHGRTPDGKRLLSARSTTAMQRRQVRLQKHSPAAISGWGLGWSLHDFDGHKVIGHDGGAIGQYSFLRVSPTRRTAVALLTNGGNVAGLYRALFDALFCAAIHRREPELPPVEPTLTIDAERYVGDYEAMGQRISIETHRGGLRASLTSRGALGLDLDKLPIAFVDRQTAITPKFHPQFDRLPMLFSDIVDGRFSFVQFGLRQHRRV